MTIVARSGSHLVLIEKLNLVGILRKSSGFKYLLSCWSDDPALQIVIKKLLVKFPQCGIACVDGVLVEWEESDGELSLSSNLFFQILNPHQDSFTLSEDV